MAEHKLPKGKNLIQGLSELGIALDYHVVREFPVLAGSRGQDPAVDVAWFGEKGQPFPLMIFEVESGAGNTIANNPLKVFAQDSAQFEKPLFYFQLIADGDASASRVDLLAKQYGTHNYRLYRIGRDEGTRFVIDVIRQHRRIRCNMDYVGVYEALIQPEWMDLVDVIAVLTEAFDIGLSTETRLADFVHLGRFYPAIRQHIPSVINHDRLHDWQSVRSMHAYFAGRWGPPILCAWMIGWHDDNAVASEWDEHFLSWQHNFVGYMPMFSPEIELSDDYSQFLLSFGGPFVACLLGLSRCKSKACSELLAVLAEVLGRIGDGEAGLQLAAWICHIAARLNCPKEYEAAQLFIERSGGLPSDGLISPPSSYSLEGSGCDEVFKGQASHPMPCDEFMVRVKQAYASASFDISEIAFSTLDEDEFCLNWAPLILASLWSNG